MSDLNFLEIVGAVALLASLTVALFTVGLFVREFAICAIQAVRARLIGSQHGAFAIGPWLRLTWWLFREGGTVSVGGRVIPRSPFEPTHWRDEA